jgi:outer membrane protein assembly factor BamB
MKTTVLFLLSLAAAGFAADTDWPTWRGPQRNGTAPGANPPLKWSESENVQWKYQIPGFGTSSPIVWGDSVFITTAIGTGKKPDGSPAAAPGQPGPGAPPPPRGAAAGPETAAAFVQTPPADPPPPQGESRRGSRGGGGGFGGGPAPTELQQFAILCIDKKTGKERWRKVVKELLPHEGHHRDHGFASASCVTDGEHLFAFFGSRGLYCCDMQGNVKWEKDLGDMKSRAGFGEGASPALHGHTLVVNWDHEGADFVVAFNKATGEELWRRDRDEPTTWTTPFVVEHEGKPQVVISGENRIRCYDLASGAEVWQCGGMTSNVIPTPVSGFGMVYALSGFRGAALRAIKIGGSGDLTNSDAIAWQHNDRTPYVPSPLLSDDRLYFYSGNNAMLSCFDAKTGKAHYAAERVAGISGVYASPVAAAGRVYLAGRDGSTVIIKDDIKLEILATNKLDDKFDASPALSGKQLFLRGHKFLYCLAE